MGIDIIKEPIELKICGMALKEDKSSKYLGVVLDRKLTLLEHVQELTRKASNKLNLVKRLANKIGC